MSRNIKLTFDFLPESSTEVVQVWKCDIDGVRCLEAHVTAVTAFLVVLKPAIRDEKAAGELIEKIDNVGVRLSGDRRHYNVEVPGDMVYSAIKLEGR